MSFSSGTFSLAAGNPVVSGTVISSTTNNNTNTDIASGLSTCLLKDGTQVATAAIPFVTGVIASSQTFAVFNTTATTINAFGAATTLNVGNASGTANILGLQRFDDTTDSTSITTGSVQTDGGLGVTKALWVGGLANITGAVTLASTLNKVTITAPAASATLTIANTGSLITSGAYAITLTATGTTNLTLPTSGTLSIGLVLGTPSSTTGGTSIDFTGIPAGVKQVACTVAGLSSNSTSNPMVQLGTTNPPESTGYLGSVGGSTTMTAFTTGFILYNGSEAASAVHGTLLLTLINSATNLWAGHGGTSANPGSGTVACVTSGSKALSGALDRIRFTFVNGTDTVDALTNANIAYQS